MSSLASSWHYGFNNSEKKRFCTCALAQLATEFGRPQLVEIWFQGTATVFHPTGLLTLLNHNIAEDIHKLSNDSNILTHMGTKHHSEDISIIRSPFHVCINWMVRDELYSLICNCENRTAEQIKHLLTSFSSYSELTRWGSTVHHSMLKQHGKYNMKHPFLTACSSGRITSTCNLVIN